MNHLKRLNINENSNNLVLNEKLNSDFDVEFNENNIKFVYDMSDVDKEIIRKLGDKEPIYPNGVKNLFKKITWKETFDLLPRVSRLVDMGLISESKPTRRLTEMGQEYYDYLFKK